MTDRIIELEEQAKVIVEWCRQQREVPEGQRDILEFRNFCGPHWEVVFEPTWNFLLGEYRLRKRPKTHKATVYWWQDTDGSIFPSLSKPIRPIGTSTVEFTEPQE